MPKMHKHESLIAEVKREFLRDVLNASVEPIPQGEAIPLYKEFLESHPLYDQIQEGWLDVISASNVNGVYRQATKDVGRGEQGELFHEQWEEGGINVPDGYISNLNATPEHRMHKRDQLERKLQNVRDQIGVEEERDQMMLPGFEAGAMSCREALEIVGGRRNADKQQSTSKVLGSEGSHSYASAGQM